MLRKFFFVGTALLSLTTWAESQDLDVAGAEARYDAQRAVADRAKARMDERERDYRRIEGEYYTAVGDQNKAQSELDSAQNYLTQINNQISSLESEISRLTSDASDLDRQRRRLEQDLHEKHHEMDQIRADLTAEKAKPAPDAAKISQLESQYNSAENEADTLQRRLTRVEDEIQDNRVTTQNKRNELAKANRDREQQLSVISDCKDQLRRAQDFVRLCQTRLSDAKSAYNTALADFQAEDRLAQQAYDYLQQVIANYNREREKVIALATQAGNNHGGREASERAPEPGAAAGKSFALARGLEIGTSEAKLRDYAKGYREGRAHGAEIVQVASVYNQGILAGREWADLKAAKEDLPRGYNDSLSSMLSEAPKGSQEIDISDTLPGDAGGSGVELSSDPKAIVGHAAPQFGSLSDPVYQLPSMGAVGTTIPQRDNRYFSAPCQNLILAEFGPLCARVYDESYGSGYQSVYKSVYTQTFKGAYDANIKSAYESALAQAFSDQTNAGLEKGANELGVLNGFAARLPSAVAENYAAGQKAFNEQMATGYLPVVRSLDLIETNRDGLFTPGETVKLKLVLDNYGDQATPKGKLNVRITRVSGLEALSSQTREVPPVNGQTRALIEGVVTAKIGVLSAKQKLHLEGVVEGGKVAFGFSVDKEAHFPLELESITLAKKPKINEAVNATLKYHNLTAEKTPESKLVLTTRPNVVSVVSDKLVVPALDAGQSAEVTASIKPGMWVGENTEVPFFSMVESFEQPFSQGLALDRDAVLLLFNSSGQPVPNSTLVVKAGSSIALQAQFKYLRNYNLGGPFWVKATSTSDPTITSSSGSTTSVNYGGWGPGMSTGPVRFSYDVPKALAGKKSWVMITLYEGNSVLHAMQVYLDIR